MLEDELKIISATEENNSDLMKKCKELFDNEVSQVKIKNPKVVFNVVFS